MQQTAPAQIKITKLNTTWDFQPCTARRCVVVVADDSRYPNYWARPLVGKEQQAVEVTCDNKTFYINNEDGTGWLRVTENVMGAYKEMQVSSVSRYLE